MKLFFCVLLLPQLVKCCQDGWASFNGHYMTRLGLALPLYLQTGIGAYRNSTNGPWKWYDGSAFDQKLISKGGGNDDGLCAYLLADNLVLDSNRGTTNPSHFYLNGRTGDFVAGPCSNFGRVSICKKKDTTNGRTEKMCGSTWTPFGSNCYKKFSEPYLTINKADDYCKLHGGHLATLRTQDEVDLAIRMTRYVHYKQINWQTAVGCYRDSPSTPWKWRDGTEFKEHGWFYIGDNNTNNCCMLITDVAVAIGKTYLPRREDCYFNNLYGSFFKAPCNYPAYQFLCQKRACDLTVSTSTDKGCVCNKGYVDITKTSLLEAENYGKGEKCVPNQCHVLKDTTILFIFDSSDSITTRHWPKMLDFVESGADKLPTKFRVGFMKFSTEISFDGFVDPGWNAREFKRAIPFKYDAGSTDTPAALKEAKKIFAGIRSKNKIAVLITDGLPFAHEYDSQEHALNATTKAAKELREAGVRLAVMGVGSNICDHADQVKEWVQDPKKDFWFLSRNVESLKGGDMDKLLNMVCNTKKK